MSKQETAKIRQALNMCKIKIKTILPYLGENKPILNQTYNKLLIDKAVLNDKLRKINPPFFIRLINKLKINTNMPKKRLICDYFN